MLAFQPKSVMCFVETHCDPQTQFDCTGTGDQCISLSQTCDHYDNCGNSADEDPSLCQHLNGTRHLVTGSTYLTEMFSKGRIFDFANSTVSMETSTNTTVTSLYEYLQAVWLITAVA